MIRRQPTLAYLLCRFPEVPFGARAARARLAHATPNSTRGSKGLAAPLPFAARGPAVNVGPAATTTRIVTWTGLVSYRAQRLFFLAILTGDS
jgi:hypothetical protein